MTPRDAVAAGAYLTGARWYALAVETRWEAPVAGALRGDGLEIYLPIEQIRQRRRGRTSLHDLPFLPGYVFVRADLQRIGAHDIQRVRGAIVLVRGASPWPTPLDDGAIAALRTLADPDGIIRPRRALAARFRTGDQVRVTDGPWAGLIGEVLTMRGPERARLLFGTLKADIAVRLLGEVAG
jgi:transcriptional antiterminator RfaH